MKKQNKDQIRKNVTSSDKIKIGILAISLFTYLYLLLFWHPAEYVNILANPTLTGLKVCVAIIFVIIWVYLLNKYYLQVQRVGKKHVDDYNFWNKFVLHYAFMKVQSISEREQILLNLKFLDDSPAKEELIKIYTESDNLKEAHSRIVEKYPYPHLRTFFSETESVLINGDDNNLVQKSALYIDSYYNDIKLFEEEKEKAYKTSNAFIVISLVLILIIKVLFGTVMIDFIDSFEGFAIILTLISVLLLLLIGLKRRLNRPLLTFGGQSDD